MKFLVLLAVVVASQAAFIPNVKLDSQWQNFKVKYGKTYSAVEELRRRQIYEDNIAFITKHNEEYAAGLHSYYVAENHLADLSVEERKALNGARAPLSRDGIAEKDMEKVYAKLAGLPRAAVIDLRGDRCLQPIKDQGQCGSCWAFSAIAAAEFAHCKATGGAVSLSEQNLVDCSSRYGNQGCNGGWYFWAYDYIIANNGVDTESYYPYTASDGSCKFSSSHVGATLRSYSYIRTNAAAMESVVGSGEVINVAIDASRIGFSFYSGGVYDDAGCSTNIDHAVNVVGYGTESLKEYWIVRNSWGRSWGDNGYILIRRGVNMCGIEDWPMSVTA